MTGINIIKNGALTTVQDSGRYYYQAYGLSVGGAMDDYAYRIANWLVGNDETAAVLEITLIGPKLKFEKDCIIAITGAELSAQLNGIKIENWRSHTIRAGDIISFGAIKQGCRCYLAVAGGIATDPVLGSRSTDLRAKLAGIDGRQLQSGDILPIGQTKHNHTFKTQLNNADIPAYSNTNVINVVAGPQVDKFTKKGLTSFYDNTYTLSDECNRMGYRLKGHAIELIGSSDIISDATVFGSIQVANNGLPMIMMADRQTSGGYAKIATVISSDLTKLAQAKPNDQVSFCCIDITLAQQKLRDYQKDLNRIKNELKQQLQIAYSETKYYNVTINKKTYQVTLQELTQRSF